MDKKSEEKIGFWAFKRVTWFQWVCFGFFVLAGTMGQMVQNRISNVFEILGAACGVAFVCYIPIALYNWLIAPRLHVQNKALKMIWKIIRVIVLVLMGLWIAIVLFALAKSFLQSFGWF